MTKRKTTLIQRDFIKGTAPNNYKPITCLPTMWNIVTAQIKAEIYCLLISRKKRCHKGTRGMGELLFIEQHILNESETRRKKKNLAMM